MSGVSPYDKILNTAAPCCKAANQSSTVFHATSGRCTCEYKPKLRKGQVRYNPKPGKLTLVRRNHK